MKVLAFSLELEDVKLLVLLNLSIQKLMFKFGTHNSIIFMIFQSIKYYFD